MNELWINGNRFDQARIRELKNEKSFQQAESELQAKADGYDTVGIQVGDKMYLAYGRGLEAKIGDMVSLNGEAGMVKFFENEANTFKEGYRRVSDSSIGRGLMQSVAGPFTVVPTALTVGAITWAFNGLAADEEVIKGLTR